MLQQTSEDLSRAIALREAVRELGIAYGNPMRLWRFPSYWYYLWENQWDDVLKFGSLLPFLLRAVDGWDGTATYIRADFVPNLKGKLMVAELNLTPVWDFATQAIREVYHNILGLSEKYSDPFPGSAKMIGGVLKRLFKGRRVVVLLSPDRILYKAEYSALSAYFRSIGINAVVSESANDLKAQDVVYRTFAEESLTRFPSLGRLADMLIDSSVSLWPGFSALESKLWMACIHGTVSKQFMVSEFTEIQRQALGQFVPWTWPVDPSRKVELDGAKLDWSSNALMGDLTATSRRKSEQHGKVFNWVLKRNQGAQGKGTVFSSCTTPDEWRQFLLNALLSFNGSSPLFVLQREIAAQQQKVTFVEPEGYELKVAAGFRARLCVSYLVEGGDSTPIDSDVTMRNHPLVHGSSDAVSMPVAVRISK